MRSHARAHGILLTLLGIVLGCVGFLRVMMLPWASTGSLAMLYGGIACAKVGFWIAVVACMRDRRMPQDDRGLPRARVHRHRR